MAERKENRARREDTEYTEREEREGHTEPETDQPREKKTLQETEKTLRDDQKINPRRIYNSYKYICTKHKNTSMYKATSNSQKRRNKQQHNNGGGL